MLKNRWKTEKDNQVYVVRRDGTHELVYPGGKIEKITRRDPRYQEVK